MCLAVPARVIELLPGDLARVDLGGTRRTVSVTLLDAPPPAGSYVLVHVGYALELLDTEEAERTLAALRDMALLDEDADDARTAGDTTR